MKTGLRIALALAAVALIGLGCGVKAPPLPADQLLPRAPSAPQYDFRPDGVLEVRFTPPTANIKGKPLEDFGGFYINRSENRLRPDFCATCPVEYRRILSIEALPPPPRKLIAEHEYMFLDRLRPGYAYYYRIYAHNSDGEYGPGAFKELVVFYDSPPASPPNLTVRSEETVVFLDWTPAQALTDNRPLDGLVGYDIYRRDEKSDWKRLNAEGPWPRSDFQDATIIKGQSYSYRVRAVREFRGTRIAGPPSAEANVTPRDLTPPPPPVIVYAVSVTEGVKLTWPRVAAPDIAGYRVYRSLGAKGGSEPIGPDIIPDNLFLDRDVRRGATYIYRVTSVDTSPARNESKPSPGVTIQHTP
jgi:hypothetical protein